MRKLRWSAALGALACTVLAGACKDIPVLPQWDADWYLPLPSQRINLDSAATAAFGFDSVPPNQSFPFSWTLSQEMNGAIGELLKKDIVGGHLIMTLTKSAGLQLGFNDTLFVSGAATGTPHGTIVFGLNMLPADLAAVDTIVLDTTNINMLSAVANDTTGHDTLYVRIRGRGYTGNSWVRLSSDTLAIRAALLARIAVSQ